MEMTVSIPVWREVIVARFTIMTVAPNPHVRAVYATWMIIAAWPPGMSGVPIRRRSAVRRSVPALPPAEMEAATCRKPVAHALKIVERARKIAALFEKTLAAIKFPAKAACVKRMPIVVNWAGMRLVLRSYWTRNYARAIAPAAVEMGPAPMEKTAITVPRTAEIVACRVAAPMWG
jgi:hypothetical protein